MENLNELQQQRADLVARLETNSHTQAGGAQIEKQIARLDQLMNAPKQLAAAEVVHKDLSAQLERLAASHKLVTDRMDQLSNEAAQAIESAQLAEQQAAADIAQAVASGDDKAAKSAQQKMDAASESVRVARAGAGAGESLCRALESQASALAQQMEEVQAKATDVRNAARSAQRLMLSAEWDAAAENLAAIGAKLMVLLPDNGFHSMGPLKVPTFLTARGYPITRDDLLKMNGGKAA